MIVLLRKIVQWFEAPVEKVLAKRTERWLRRYYGLGRKASWLEWAATLLPPNLASWYGRS